MFDASTLVEGKRHRLVRDYANREEAIIEVGKLDVEALKVAAGVRQVAWRRADGRIGVILEYDLD